MPNPIKVTSWPRYVKLIIYIIFMNFQDPLNLNSNDGITNAQSIPIVIEPELRPEPTKAIVTIKKNPLTVRTVPIPFYLMKELPKPGKITGQTNLLSHYGLESYYRKMTKKRLVEKLEEFHNTLGAELKIAGYVDKSSLKNLVDNPPICGKELRQLSASAITAFRLNPGTLPVQYHPTARTITSGRTKTPSPTPDTCGDAHAQPTTGTAVVEGGANDAQPPPPPSYPFATAKIEHLAPNETPITPFEQSSLNLLPKRRKRDHKDHHGKKKKRKQ